MKTSVWPAFILAFSVVVAAQSTDSHKTVWEGVYTEAQAARGQSQYATHCSNCHREDLSGYSGLLRGNRFMEKFREASLHLLFDKTKTTMPRGAAGTLSDETYVDIVSYLLKMNEFPVGRGSCAPSCCRKFGRLENRAGAGAQLCSHSGRWLSHAVGSGWLMTNTTEPVRSGNPQPTEDERRVAEQIPLGSLRRST